MQPAQSPAPNLHSWPGAPPPTCAAGPAPRPQPGQPRTRPGPSFSGPWRPPIGVWPAAPPAPGLAPSPPRSRELSSVAGCGTGDRRGTRPASYGRHRGTSPTAAGDGDGRPFHRETNRNWALPHLQKRCPRRPERRRAARGRRKEPGPPQAERGRAAEKPGPPRTQSPVPVPLPCWSPVTWASSDAEILTFPCHAGSSTPPPGAPRHKPNESALCVTGRPRAQGGAGRGAGSADGRPPRPRAQPAARVP